MPDRKYEFTEQESRGSKKVFAAFLSCLVLFMLPVFGLLFNSSELILGLPISVWAIFTISAYMTIVTLISYKLVFKPWAERVDREV